MSNSKTLLLIEDDAALSLLIEDRLRAEGYIVDVAGDGTAGYNLARSRSFDMIILDLMLPGMSGLEVCKNLRAEDIKTPILMLTALGQVSDKVVGLKLGADDYLTKPFEMIELVARVEALLRRPQTFVGAQGTKSYDFGKVHVDLVKMEVTNDAEPIELTAKEFQLLAYLIENRGKLLTREVIMNDVWGYETAVNSRTVDTHVAWLRQKLEVNPKHPQYIATYRGLGYKFLG